MVGSLSWSLAALVLAGATYAFLEVGGGDVADAVVLVAVTALSATAAHLAIGLTARPVLALSVPLIAGWWTATLLPATPLTALAAAALAGLVVGAGIGPAVGGSLARCAAVTLLLALVGEGLSAGFAAEHIGGNAADVPPLPVIAGIALVALAIGWWAEGSLGAALLHRASAADRGAGVGLRAGLAWTLAMALGGVPAGLAGALLAQSGGAPPGVLIGTVLAVAALAGGLGMLGGALALTGALWLVPELLARTALVTVDVELLAAALAALALLVALLAGSLRPVDARPHG